MNDFGIKRPIANTAALSIVSGHKGVAFLCLCQRFKTDDTAKTYIHVFPAYSWLHP